MQEDFMFKYEYRFTVTQVFLLVVGETIFLCGNTKMAAEFQWNGRLTPNMKKSFDDNGYFIARNFLENEELKQIWKVLEEPDGILKHSYMTYESDGKRIQQTLCLFPGSDVTGMLARSEKVVKSCEQLLGYEVYHWCSMFMFKDARMGGEHVWHQDYGFWYNNGCLYPDTITVWMPLDPCRKDNSCKQVLSGSHKLGRLNHFLEDNGQLGVDKDRIEHIKQICDHVYLEMDAGDVFFHHGNLLHRSDANLSDRPRMAFLSCYNPAHNSPVIDDEYPKYNKIDIVPDNAIKECKNYTDFSGKLFHDYGINKMQ